MSGVPERIWAWYFHADQQDDVMHGGWSETVDCRETAYVRADISEAAKAAPRAEGERIGMERAIQVVRQIDPCEGDDFFDGLERSIRAIRAAMDAKP